MHILLWSRAHLAINCWGKQPSLESLLRNRQYTLERNLVRQGDCHWMHECPDDTRNQGERRPLGPSGQSNAKIGPFLQVHSRTILLLQPLRHTIVRMYCSHKERTFAIVPASAVGSRRGLRIFCLSIQCALSLFQQLLF